MLVSLVGKEKHLKCELELKRLPVAKKKKEQGYQNAVQFVIGLPL